MGHTNSKIKGSVNIQDESRVLIGIKKDSKYCYITADLISQENVLDTLKVRILASIYSGYVAIIYALFAWKRYDGAKGDWYLNIPKSALAIPAGVASFSLNAPMAYVFFFTFFKFIGDIKKAWKEGDKEVLVATTLGITEGFFTAVISAPILQDSAGELLKLIPIGGIAEGAFGLSLTAFFTSMLTTRVYGGAKANRKLIDKSHEIKRWILEPEYRQVFRLRWLMQKYVDQVDVKIPSDFESGEMPNFIDFTRAFFLQLQGGTDPSKIIAPPNEITAWLNWMIDWGIGFPGGVWLAHYMTALFLALGQRGFEAFGWKGATVGEYAVPVAISALSNVFFYMLSLGLVTHVGKRFYSVGASRFMDMPWHTKLGTVMTGLFSPFLAYLSGFGFGGEADEMEENGFGSVGTKYTEQPVYHSVKKGYAEIATMNAGGVNWYALVRFCEKYTDAFSPKKYMPGNTQDKKNRYFQEHFDFTKLIEILNAVIINGDLEEIGGKQLTMEILSEESQWRNRAKETNKNQQHWCNGFFGCKTSSQKGKKVVDERTQLTSNSGEGSTKGGFLSWCMGSRS